MSKGCRQNQDKKQSKEFRSRETESDQQPFGELKLLVTDLDICGVVFTAHTMHRNGWSKHIARRVVAQRDFFGYIPCQI